MEEEDKEFFVLILGVLAAVILVVSWWFMTGGVTTPIVQGAISDQSNDNLVADTDAEVDAAEVDRVEAAEDGAQADINEANSAPDHEASDNEAAGANSNSAGDEAANAGPLPPSVFDAIAADPDLTVLRDLLRDSDLDQVLASAGPYTLFAPSNDAISQAASSDATISVLENDREAVLTYHVVSGAYTLDDLADLANGDRSADLPTVQGESISLSLDAGNVLINGSATVSPNGIDTDNGHVYILDNVLVPPVATLNTLVGLEPILFATGSADIDPESFPTLDRFIEVLESSSVDVTIGGHTDSSGDPLLNQTLSEDRARSVLNYLVGNGVDESRLAAQGFGPERPVADNDTEAGRALNRRIEFTLG